MVFLDVGTGKCMSVDVPEYDALRDLEENTPKEVMDAAVDKAVEAMKKSILENTGIDIDKQGREWRAGKPDDGPIPFTDVDDETA